MIGEENVAKDARRGTVLLLCSDGAMLTVLLDILEKDGYVVLPAPNLARAIDWIQRAQIDLLIVRPHIDSMTGEEAALFLRSKQNGLRILMVGGFVADDRIAYHDQLRRLEVFPPPFSASALLDRVHQVLSEPTAVRDIR